MNDNSQPATSDAGNANVIDLEAGQERWRYVPGYEGLYEVSDYGNVRSFLNPGNHKRKLSGGPRLLRLCNNPAGYFTVSLGRNGVKYSHKLVHSLVCAAFIGPRPDGLEVAHLNGCRTDNRLSNLKYVSHKENESHKRSHGTSPEGTKNGMATLLEWQVKTIHWLVENGISQASIAELLTISKQHVSEVATGKRWSSVEKLNAREDLPALVRRVRERDKRIAELEAVVNEWATGLASNRSYNYNSNKREIPSRKWQHLKHSELAAILFRVANGKATDDDRAALNVGQEGEG